MGLDMYLTAKQYLWKSRDEFSGKRQEIAEALGVKGIEAKEVSFDAMYWRKANAIHNWFVNNVQDGEDECQEHYVSKEQLVELSTICKQALLELNAELLPPTAGFFFGSTEIDEWYWDDLRKTADGIDGLLANPATEHWDFYYRSSW